MKFESFSTENLFFVLGLRTDSVGSTGKSLLGSSSFLFIPLSKTTLSVLLSFGIRALAVEMRCYLILCVFFLLMCFLLCLFLAFCLTLYYYVEASFMMMNSNFDDAKSPND